MIQSFHSKETEKIFKGEFSSKLPHDIQRIALRKLSMIHAASTIRDLKIPPSNFLEQLKRYKEERYSIRINNQWRVCFTWKMNNAYDVEIIDYH